MNRDYLAEFLPDLAEFYEKTMKFHNGEMTVAEYKGFSGGFGSYAQRGGKKHMLRLRMAGGQLTKSRLKFIVNTCEKYNIAMMKLTTCQSIQLHDLEASDLCDMIADAWKADMITRGGGGDFPRNIMASPLTGVSKDEYFNVLPCAQAAGQYLMHYIKETKFPRKLKVCFSASPENEPHATFRDLGFVARPDQTFDVYCAGGLGNNPKLGIKVSESVKPEDILYYIDAMVRCFVEYGNYENRGRSRTRYLQDTLGAEGLKKAFHEKLAQIRSESDLSVPITQTPVTKTGDGTAAPENIRIIPQKQDGLYAVFYQPSGGLLTPETAKKLYELIANIDESEIRITPEEGLYIINLTGTEAKNILEATADSACTEFEKSVACIGAAICQVGIGDSQSILMECLDAVKKENFADGVLPKVHFSGCPSSCSAHQTAEIGFRGAMKQTQNGPEAAFAIHIGGCALQGKECIAETGKAMARKDIPDFLVELGRTVAKENMTYRTWASSHQKELAALVEKYTA